MTSANSTDSFDAFISYSRGDVLFARELERRLEKHRVSDATTGRRRRLRVFRDEHDMVGSDYFRSIEIQLERSRKLIVVCSPRAAKSTFVDDEIRRFLATHGSDDVIPVLLDGLPDNESDADPSLKAFPPTLSESMEMPLAVDYRSEGSKPSRIDRGCFVPAWFMLLAGILEVSREQIERRELIRRRRLVMTSFAACAAIIVALSGLTAWALWQRSVAQAQTRLAMSQQLAASSRLQMRTDLSHGLLLAVKAMQYAQTPQAYGPLIDALAATNALRVILHGFPSEVLDIAFSETGEQLAAGGVCRRELGTSNCVSGPAMSWDLRSGGIPQGFAGQIGSVLSVSFDAAGERLISVSDDGSAALWDTASGASLGYLRVAAGEGAGSIVADALFEPDGTVFIADEGGYRSVSPAEFDPSPPQRAPASYHDYRRRVRAKSPPGMTIRDSRDGLAIVTAPRPDTSDDVPDAIRSVFDTLDLEIGREQRWATVVGNPARDDAWIADLDMSRDGRWIAVTASGNTGGARLLVIDARNDRLAHDIPVPDFGVNRVAVSPDGRFVAVGSCIESGEIASRLSFACSASEVRIWATESGDVVAAPLAVVGSRVAALEFSPDSRRLAVASCVRQSTSEQCVASQIGLWSVGGSGDDSTMFRTITEVAAPAEDSAIAAYGANKVTRHADGLRVEHSRSMLWFYEDDRAEPVAVAEPHGNQIRTAVISNDGQFVATGGNDASIKIWSRNGELLRTLQGAHADDVVNLEFSADGRHLASYGDDRALKLWDVDTWTVSGSAQDGGHPLIWPVFGMGSRLLAAYRLYEGTVGLWETDRGLPVTELTFESLDSRGPRLEFDDDGVLLLSSARYHVRWNLNSAAMIDLACRRSNRELTENEWASVGNGLKFELACSQP